MIDFEEARFHFSNPSTACLISVMSTTADLVARSITSMCTTVQDAIVGSGLSLQKNTTWDASTISYFAVRPSIKLKLSLDQTDFINHADSEMRDSRQQRRQAAKRQ